MHKVLTNGTDIKIGAYKFPDRQKICLCIDNGNEINEIMVYRTFNTAEGADDFMNKLAEFLGIEVDNG